VDTAWLITKKTICTNYNIFFIFNAKRAKGGFERIFSKGGGQGGNYVPPYLKGANEGVVGGVVEVVVLVDEEGLTVDESFACEDVKFGVGFGVGFGVVVVV
jgi:hypothetical protein